MSTNIKANILLDSITDDGSRLSTWVLEYPRNVHAELLTHRAFSRNSASSRAIPTAKLRKRVEENPAIPVHWGANQKGMQADTEINDSKAAQDWWLRGRDLMVAHHEEGEHLGLHKQIVNRVIEPWMMITIVCSFTDGANFFSLRNHRAAEPNLGKLAGLMWEEYLASTPVYLAPGSWHLPFIREGDREGAAALAQVGETEEDVLKKISTGRNARVSYLTHFGTRDLSEDIRLHDDLAATANMGADPMHASPFEHPAVAVGGRQRFGNFEGWKQYRKFFPKENGPDTSNRCLRCGMWAGMHTRSCPRAL